MTNTVLLTIENNIATIAFNRPEQMNTYNDVMSKELLDVVKQVKLDTQVRAVVLRGMGNVFMAGGDLQYFHSNLPTISDCVHTLLHQLTVTIHDLQTMNKPVLAVTHGAVAGVGLSLMLAADLAITAKGTKFTTAYSKLGLTPDGGASYFLPRVVGMKKAMELFFLAEQFDADKALELGLVNWVVPMEELNSEAEKRLAVLANGPTQAYAGIKSLLMQTMSNRLLQQLESEAASFVNCTTTKDFHTGVKAFVKKSVPEFEGV